MSPRARARQLIPRYLDGQASADEVRELETLLAEHHNCADLFADCTGLELGLEALFHEIDAIFCEVMLLAPPSGREQRWPRARVFVTALVVAGLVGGVIVLLTQG